MKEPHTLVQSYVMGRYFVSTIYRRASGLELCFYYETMAWELDKSTGATINTVIAQEASSSENEAWETHAQMCRNLSKQTSDSPQPHGGSK